MVGKKYYISECPSTGHQFLVEHGKAGNIIELTSDNIQAITNIRISQEKTFIFLTVDGTTKDGTGEDVENCQMLAIAKGEDALTAYNNMINSGWLAGNFDTCFCYQLASEEMSSFDLISHDGMSDKSCPDCDETLCEDMSDNKLFCTECGDDTVFHCDNCEKAIGKSDYEIGHGKCVECNNQ